MMTFTIRGGVGNPPPRIVTARAERKIALCGSHSASLKDAPWTDPTWEFWGHASSRAWYKRTMDRYFDLHPKACWDRGGKKGSTYPKWLARNTVPIFMQKMWDEVPASIEYPLGRILLEFGESRPYFANHAAYMIALALTEGVTTIALFGINYSVRSEYVTQRASCEYWLGVAKGKGVKIVLPTQCSLLREPGRLYGYESHDEETGVLKPEYQAKRWKNADTITPVAVDSTGLAKPPKEILEQIKAEEREHPRPDWARWDHATPKLSEEAIQSYLNALGEQKEQAV